jgi:hypothetical protein
VPATTEIAPGDRCERPYDLADGSWTADRDLGELLAPGGALSAVYAVGPSREAAEQRAWTGRAASAPITLGDEGLH